MSNSSMRGRFVWHELMTNDTKSAADFFSKVVGWKPTPWDQDPSYTMFMMKGRPMAGLMALPEEARRMGTPPCWIVYVATPDLDATVAQAVALGGKVHKQPTEIPTIGRFAVLADPQGAIFLAFTPTSAAAPPNAAPADGDFSWHELATTDWKGALAFYKGLFGWQETNAMDMGPDGIYQMFGVGGDGVTLGGMFNKSVKVPGPPAWLAYIKVADTKKAVAAIKKAGGQIVNGPMEVPGGSWIAVGLDRQGAAFAVNSAAPAPKKRKRARKAGKAGRAGKKTAKRKIAKRKARKGARRRR